MTVDLNSRNLLIGANGAGKSTLLRLAAGRHLVRSGELQVLGHSPFFGLSLARDIALIDGDFPLQLDLRVHELLEATSASADPGLQAELIELLGIDRDWRMSRVSEGQRRRVQLLLGLRRPVRLLLLDEVTAHLDLVMRADLLDWLKARSESHGLTILHTTHILDGLWMPSRRDRGGWPTHLITVRFSGPPTRLAIDAIPELREPGSSLLSYCEDLIRKDVKG